MKRTLYYTVDNEKEGDSQDGFTLTGNKSVNVYEMVNNSPQHFFDLDLDITDTSEEKIQEYLDDNGYGDEEFTLIWL